MRHGKKIHKLGRPAEHRKALLNNLAAALIKHKQIQTTDTKAKALKPYIDRLISKALQDTLHAKRQIARNLPNKAAFKELFGNIVPRLEGRTSGFTRIVKHKARRGDGAPLAFIQLLLEKTDEGKGKKKAGKKAVAPKPRARAESKSMMKKEAQEEPAIEEEALVPESAESEVSEAESKPKADTTEDTSEDSDSEEKKE